MTSKRERRGALPRRCAWCERFCVDGEWIVGRRDADSTDSVHAHGASMTHTICDDCIGRLQETGRSV